MVEKITSEQFDEADGTEDWRVTAEVAHAEFKTGSFAKGLALVNEIGRLAEAANHHPDIALSYPSVGVSLSTHEVDGLTERDVDLAGKISAAARDMDIAADPTATS
jgi:4a-hydroxytetrahydrobiopterin dehydratase